MIFFQLVKHYLEHHKTLIHSRFLMQRTFVNRLQIFNSNIQTKMYNIRSVTEKLHSIVFWSIHFQYLPVHLEVIPISLSYINLSPTFPHLSFCLLNTRISSLGSYSPHLFVADLTLTEWDFRVLVTASTSFLRGLSQITYLDIYNVLKLLDLKTRIPILNDL